MTKWQRWQTMCPCDTYKKRMQMGWHANKHTLSIYYMLNITILANGITWNNLYQVNIFQNAHIAAYGETHMHTPQSFHPIVDKFHTIGKKKNPGRCESRNRHTKYKRRKINYTTWIYIIRTIGNTNIGGSTYTEE